jgi:hypothetical protein
VFAVVFAGLRCRRQCGTSLRPTSQAGCRPGAFMRRFPNLFCPRGRDVAGKLLWRAIRSKGAADGSRHPAATAHSPSPPPSAQNQPRPQKREREREPERERERERERDDGGEGDPRWRPVPASSKPAAPQPRPKPPPKPTNMWADEEEYVDR